MSGCFKFGFMSDQFFIHS